ncbi:hypothetical protein F5141DRAFT_1000131 [Pisolithus sp. B1]|nr:hypothetical protein F5141DRAFT_1000131 [Pisolithus sp. B1]
MYIPGIPEAVQLHDRSLATDSSPLSNATFMLNSSGIGGLLGGEEALSTVALAQIYNRRKWLGWYNTPGTYIIGKHLRRLARSVISDLHANPGPGTESGMVQVDLALLLQHSSRFKGPVFKGIYSGTSLHETGPLASLLMKKYTGMSGTLIEGRTTQPVNVTIANLEQNPSLQSQMTFDHSAPICAIIPIAVSLATCGICGLYCEWYAFSMILLGILARGLTCVFVGSGELVFDHPELTVGSPPGDGILGCDHELVLLKGHENVVNAITRGRFIFHFRSKHAFRMVELCSFFLIAQAIAQLICVPQSNLFGQLMFVFSVVTSWVFSLWFLPYNKVEVQEEFYRSVLRSPKLEKFVLPNRSSAIVSLLLFSGDNEKLSGDSKKLKKIMDGFLPSGTQVWEIWKGIVIEHLTNGQPLCFDDTHWNHQDLPSESDRSLLRTLLKDAETAYTAFGSNK